MAKLVQQRAQERAEGYDLLARDRAHPHADDCSCPILSRLIETMQLTPVAARAHREHFDAYRRHLEPCGELREQFLGSALHLLTPFRTQLNFDLCHHTSKRGTGGQSDAFDRIAL